MTGGCLMDSLSGDMVKMLRQYEARAAELREEIEQRQKELERIEQRLLSARETREMLTEWRQAQEAGGKLPRAVGQANPATKAGEPPVKPGTQPTLKQMVLHVLEAHGRAMTPADMYHACQSQGWAVNRNSLGATLTKLVHDGLIVRVGEGQYTLP